MEAPREEGVVATINDEVILREAWLRAVALDRAMSTLAGAPPPSPEAVLSRLVNEHLVRQRAQAERITATLDQAEARLKFLLERWGADEKRLAQVLGENGLTRAQVVESIRQLLIVEAYLARLGSDEAAAQWLRSQRRQARVGLYVDLAAVAHPTAIPPPRQTAPATPLVFAAPTELPPPTPLVLAPPTPIPTPPPAPIPAANVAPDFTLPDLDGRPVSLSQFRGKVVALNFWASWCPSCRAEARDFGEFARLYRDRGVVVVGVNLREGVEGVRAFAQANGMDYPLLLDAEGSVGALYEVVGIPTTLFLDAAGEVKARHVGILTLVQLEGYVAQLLTP
ncbi:MAG: redoxin domain-containing protein [Thermoflexales bacterium]|nr:redoxin domain-containing protein [Thermoflexales bacterium]